MLGVQHARRLWHEADLHGIGRSGSVHVQRRSSVLGVREHLRERFGRGVHGGHARVRLQGFIDRLRGGDAGVPAGRVRGLFARNHAVLGEWPADVREQRTVGSRGGLRGPSSVYDERQRSSFVHVRGVVVLPGWNDVPGRSDACNLRRRCQQLRLYQWVDNVCASKDLFGDGSCCFVFAHVLR